MAVGFNEATYEVAYPDSGITSDDPPSFLMSDNELDTERKDREPLSRTDFVEMSP